MFLRKIFFFSIFFLLVASVLGYGFYKALPLILGPKIEVSSPNDGDIIEGTTVVVRGSVERTQKLFINGIATAISNNGLFESRLAIYPGNNILVFEALDKFNRKKTYTISVGTK